MVPTQREPVIIDLNGGESVVFIGANGAGKTRLGIFIDQTVSNTGKEVHRISAHRSLTLNPDITPPSLETATRLLRFGYNKGTHQHKSGHRFGNNPATALLSDFDHLLSALYAENNDLSVAYRRERISAPELSTIPPLAKIDTLKIIWDSLLPHRELVILSNNIKTRPTNLQTEDYSASEMSDGERVIFYLIGQALLAQPETILVFDEPELHINKSILARLWDEVEASRPDCAFLYITHDVEFAASRHAAKKYALRGYNKTPHEWWDVEEVPAGEALPDDVVAKIIGSRRPILVVEGDGGSLDSALYRRVYTGFTVIPVGSCERVIHTVSSFAARPELHRVGCAGIIDADGRTAAEAEHLEQRGVYLLPVSEVENLLLLPGVFLAIAAALMFSESDALAKLNALKAIVFRQCGLQLDDICLRYTRRRIDAQMKKIGLSSTDITTLESEYRTEVSALSPAAIFSAIKLELAKAISDGDYEKILLHFDNKGLLAEAAKILGYQQRALEEFIGRALRLESAHAIHGALAACLPAVVARP